MDIATATAMIIPMGMITIIRTHMTTDTITIIIMTMVTVTPTTTSMRMGTSIITRPIPMRTTPTDRESATRTIWSRRGSCWPM